MLALFSSYLDVYKRTLTEACEALSNVRSGVTLLYIVDLKGYSVDLKGYNVDLKGYSVALKGYNVDLKAYSVDLKGNLSAYLSRCRYHRHPLTPWGRTRSQGLQCGS